MYIAYVIVCSYSVTFIKSHNQRFRGQINWDVCLSVEIIAFESLFVILVRTLKRSQTLHTVTNACKTSPVFDGDIYFNGHFEKVGAHTTCSDTRHDYQNSSL